KSRFVVAVSHDLQSPLTAIRASVESLLDQDGVQSAQMHEQLLHNIAGQASRLDRLVDELLDLARIEAGVLLLDRDWIELPALIADTLAKFESCTVDAGWSGTWQRICLCSMSIPSALPRCCGTFWKMP